MFVFKRDGSAGGLYPNTNLAPSSVAACNIRTPSFSKSKPLITNGTSNKIAAKIT
jgi:hypothetical protein